MGIVSQAQNLQGRAPSALRRLQDLVAKRAIHNKKGGMVAWGQYLDPPAQSRQVGVYGTAAAMEILSMGAEGSETHASLIDKGARWLHNEFHDRTSKSWVKGDVALTYKCAAYVSAMGHAEPQEELRHASPPVLLKKKGRKGWGEYHFGGKAADTPRVLPTAMAWVALSHHSDVKFSHAAESLQWLSNEAQSRYHTYTENRQGINQEAICTELALVALALSRHAANFSGRGRWLRTEKSKVCRLLDKVALRHESLDDQSPHFRPFVLPRSDNHSKLLILPCKPIVCLAIMESLEDRAMGHLKFLVRSLEFYAQQFLLDGAFRSNITERMSTCDQLWIARCLAKFEEAQL